MSKILIVEGKNDCAKIKLIYPQSLILTTNGSEVSDIFLENIKRLSNNNEIILFLDPDFSGEYIRKKIMSVVPNAQHVFIKKNEAISKNKKKVGVEHASLENIKKALDNIISCDYHRNITYEDIYEMGLVGESTSKIKRQELCDKLKIGYVNGKQLVNRLNLFNFTLEEIKEIL